MDYQFGHDLSGQPDARFSAEHQALGLWLQSEIRDDRHLISRILQAIEELRHRQRRDYRLTGQEYSLQISTEGAEVAANALAADWSDWSDGTRESESEELSVWELEQRCDCGLDDFEAMLKEWRSFLG